MMKESAWLVGQQCRLANKTTSE